MSTVVVLMGVAGSGKTTVGRALADRSGWSFVDADDLHPAANVAKMAAGTPLDDADRRPWLAALAELVDERVRHGPDTVLACSALKRAYREHLVGGRDGVRFVYLRADRATITDRMRRRHDHFMAPELAASQFDTLEEPAADDALWVDADRPVEDLVADLIAALGAGR